MRDVKAEIIYQYLKEYHQFENFIKKLFYKEYLEFTAENKRMIAYFIGLKYGSNTKLEYDDFIGKVEVREYNEKSYKKISYNEIIRITMNKRMLFSFNEKFISLQTRRDLDCYNMCISFMEMRNILAHETSTMDLNGKAIDVLSKESIKEFAEQNGNEWLKEISELYNTTDGNEANILSNFVYMKMAHEELKKRSDKYTIKRINDDEYRIIDNNSGLILHKMKTYPKEIVEISIEKILNGKIKIEDDDIISIIRDNDRYDFSVNEYSKHGDICEKYFSGERDTKKIKNYLINSSKRKIIKQKHNKIG